MASLVRVIEDNASQHGDSLACVIGGERRTYAELADEVLRFASALRRLGLQPGDRLSLYMPNRMEYVPCFYGAMPGRPDRQPDQRGLYPGRGGLPARRLRRGRDREHSGTVLAKLGLTPDGAGRPGW